MKKTITRRFKFDSAHSLPGYPGKCQELHGHTWHLEIEISGIGMAFPQMHADGTKPVNYEHFFVDFSDLKKIVNLMVINNLDHKYLNDAINQVPTAENILEWIVTQLYEVFTLERVRLYENLDESWAEWKREG